MEVLNTIGQLMLYTEISKGEMVPKWKKDTTADYSDEFMRAALVTNLPNYASAIVTANEVLDSISSTKAARMTAR
jgi:hypothetical protein